MLRITSRTVGFKALYLTSHPNCRDSRRTIGNKTCNFGWAAVTVILSSKLLGLFSYLATSRRQELMQYSLVITASHFNTWIKAGSGYTNNYPSMGSHPVLTQNTHPAQYTTFPVGPPFSILNSKNKTKNSIMTTSNPWCWHVCEM